MSDTLHKRRCESKNKNKDESPNGSWGGIIFRIRSRITRPSGSPIVLSRDIAAASKSPMVSQYLRRIVILLLSLGEFAITDGASDIYGCVDNMHNRPRPDLSTVVATNVSVQIWYFKPVQL